MSVALEHCWDLLEQVTLDDDPVVYPAQLFVAPIDTHDLSGQIVEHLDDGVTVLVMLEDASQCLFAPEPASRLRRRMDRVRGRIRVRIELRPTDGLSLAWDAAVSRAAFERKLLPTRTRGATDSR